MTQLQEYLFGIPVSTHRSHEDMDGDGHIDGTFPYEFTIAAISICFFRTTIHLNCEHKFWILRWFFGILLGFLAYNRKSYELICSVELFSYAVPYILFTNDLRIPTIINNNNNNTTTTTNNDESSKHKPTTTTTATAITNGHGINNNNSNGKNDTTTGTQQQQQQQQHFFSNNNLIRIVLVAASGTMSLILCHAVATGVLLRYMLLITPTFIKNIISSGLPIQEIASAYDILDKFIYEQGLLKTQVQRLFFTTFHIQCGIGYLGIDFLKQEQERRNQLIRMDVDDDNDNDKDNTSTTTTTNNENKKDKDNNKQEAAAKTINDETYTKSSKETTTTTTDNKNNDEHSLQARKIRKSKKFQRSAGPFILFTAVPYMVQIIFYGNLNAFAFFCFKHDVHRAIRLYDLFENDNNLVALAEHSARSPEAFAGYMDVIVTTTYDLFNRKLFSLPKVLLLPVVMARQPKMMAQIFPIIFLTDWLKGRAVAYMTTRVEQLEKEMQEIMAIRSKVEAFDMKNAELLQRASVGTTATTDFTRRRWEELTVQVQMKTVAKDLTARTKGFFAWIERNFVFSVLVDCALAHLIAVGKIVAADIFVFSRAIEDAVDMVLMKSRSEAELARMMTQIDNMEELATVWEKAKARNLLHCNVASPPPKPTTELEHLRQQQQPILSGKSNIVLRNLLYSRGTAVVRVDHLELKAGVYALTGANGSGKSTLFRVLMSCETNDRPIDLPPSIVLSTPFEPIIEQDDVEREVICEDADKEDQATMDEDTTSTTKMDEMEIDPSGQTNSVVSDGNSTAQRQLEAHPRLSITMPSSHVVEISQTFYWPLYAKPIDWIFQEHVTETCTAEELDRRLRRVAEELHSLEFSQSLAIAESSSSSSQQQQTLQTKDDNSNDNSELNSFSADAINGIMDQLLEEKEDWFNDLSGGQRSKVELVRKVFLQEECPHVLLIDETMAPLDPRSKSLVMARIKGFCQNSVVIVIYHTDVGREQQQDDNTGGNDGEGKTVSVECVPSNDFFDGNIHVENQGIHLRPVC